MEVKYTYNRMQLTFLFTSKFWQSILVLQTMLKWGRFNQNWFITPSLPLIWRKKKKKLWVWSVPILYSYSLLILLKYLPLKISLCYQGKVVLVCLCQSWSPPSWSGGAVVVFYSSLQELDLWFPMTIIQYINNCNYYQCW